MSIIDTDKAISKTNATVADSARNHFARTVEDYTAQLALKSYQCASLEQIPGQPVDLIERHVRQASKHLASIYGASPKRTPWLIVLFEFLFISASSFFVTFSNETWGMSCFIICTIIAAILLVVHVIGENGNKI